MAPVVTSCGTGASVSHALCNITKEFCSSKGLAAPICRDVPQFSPPYVTSGTVNTLRQSDDASGGVCAGDCDDDDDCVEGLKCWERDTRDLPVPGC
eukprot:SAG31_NODE_2650_length_5298_cov_1.690710_8_plen_95_part_01